MTPHGLSRLDYCNAVLAGLPASTLAPFQRVLHAAAGTVMDLKPRDGVTSSSESCTGCQSLRGASTSCASWFTSRF